MQTKLLYADTQTSHRFFWILKPYSANTCTTQQNLINAQMKIGTNYAVFCFALIRATNNCFLFATALCLIIAT